MASWNTRTLSTRVIGQHPAETIILPIANPFTAPPLLEIAERLLQADTDTGRIILLYVVTDDDDSHTSRIAEFESIIESAYRDGKRAAIELKIHRAENIVDGILEVAEQNQACMILLGLSYSIRGQVELGPVVERVAERATCDVGVFRSAYQPYVKRIVVPVGGSLASRVTLSMGIRLADGYGLPCEALHVYSDSSEAEAYRHVENLLTVIPENHSIRINVIPGVNEARSVLSSSDENDLLVIGFSERNPLQKWLYGDTAQQILDRANGPVLMVSRAIDNSEVQALTRRRLSWLRPLLTETEQEHVIWLAKDSVLPTLDYFVLLVIAAMIAALGLLLNSSAVVIGAMLVAPLMQPIIALGIALCTARLKLMRKAIVTIVLSVVIALAVGVIVGVLLPPAAPTKEMLARAYPSLLDAAVALSAGFIGAYATARKDIPAALAGVAIAAALVPPICTVGLSLALLEPRLALGAAFLFLTNLVCITVIAAVVFFWMGMRPTRLDNISRRRRYGVMLTGIIAMLLIVGGMLNYTHQPSVERISETRLKTVFEPAELTNLQIFQQDPLLVIATVRTTTELAPETVKMAQLQLTEDLDTTVRLRIIVQRVIEGS